MGDHEPADVVAGLRFGDGVQVAALAGIGQPDRESPLDLRELADVEQSSHSEAEGIGLLPGHARTALAKDGRRFVAEARALRPLTGKERAKPRRQRTEAERMVYTSPFALTLPTPRSLFQLNRFGFGEVGLDFWQAHQHDARRAPSKHLAMVEVTDRMSVDGPGDILLQQGVV